MGNLRRKVSQTIEDIKVNKRNNVPGLEYVSWSTTGHMGRHILSRLFLSELFCRV